MSYFRHPIHMLIYRDADYTPETSDEKLFDEFISVANKIQDAILVQGVDPDDPLLERLDDHLDVLGAELGFCDLGPVADRLIEMTTEESLDYICAAYRDKDTCRRYKGECVRPEKRLAIYLRDQFRCVYCGEDLKQVEDFEITLDRVIPNSMGGGQEPTNLVTTCRSCNCSRKDTPINEFLHPRDIERLRLHLRRSYKMYHKLAKALLAGEFTLHDIRRRPRKPAQ